MVTKDSQGVPYERSKHLNNFKKDHNLPTFKKIKDDLRKGLVEQVDASILRMGKFAEAQRMLYETMHSAGWDVTNVFHNIIDLQNKKLELEEELALEGKNPLLSPEWVKANEMLTKQIEFVHKHKLELSKFNYGVQKTAERDEDELFKVEGSLDE